MTAIALTIAGSDSGGGAGIQADLKTFSARGVYGASVLTALTAQNTLGVQGVHDVPADFVAAQLDSVLDDLAVDAIKIGMLSQPDVIAVVAEALEEAEDVPAVLDPVMIAESGDALIVPAAIETIRRQLLPLADLITPNLHEAAALLGTEVAATRDAMEDQAGELIDTGADAVLVKGGHFEAEDAADFLLTSDGTSMWISAPFVPTKNTHGTGCSLSSAIAAELAKGAELEDAVRAAKRWLSGALSHADELTIGAGAGPVHHFYDIWKG